jgi:hypothetical protein
MPVRALAEAAVISPPGRRLLERIDLELRCLLL